MAAAGGLAGLAVASSLLADGGGSDTGYGAPSGGYGAPSSGYAEPSSGYSAPSSGYSAPSSGYSAPSSGYSAPSSGYSAPSSGYSAPSSGYSAPSSGHGHSRVQEADDLPQFHYQWQQNIAKLSRGKRDVTDRINQFIEVTRNS